MKYVAFLDILGFKDLVENNSNADLIKIYDEALSFAEEKAFQIWEYMPELNDKVTKLNFVVVSDSLLLWTDTDDSKAFFKINFSVQSLLYAFLINGLPLRGAIVHGNLESIIKSPKYLNSTFSVHLGDALVKAFNIEKQQNWSGCIITDDVINTFVKNRIENDILIEEFVKLNIITKYMVPMKTGAIVEKYVIKWPSLNRIAPIDASIIRGSFALHNKNIKNWDVEIKIRNTIDFFNQSK